MLTPLRGELEEGYRRVIEKWGERHSSQPHRVRGGNRSPNDLPDWSGIFREY